MYNWDSLKQWDTFYHHAFSSKNITTKNNLSKCISILTNDAPFSWTQVIETNVRLAETQRPYETETTKIPSLATRRLSHITSKMESIPMSKSKRRWQDLIPSTSHYYMETVILLRLCSELYVLKCMVGIDIVDNAYYMN